MSTLTREQALIDAIRQALPPENAAMLGDDAFLDAETGAILTTDMLVSGRHFDLSYFSPEDLGWKAAAVNVSDIAATGGVPDYLLVSLALGPNEAGEGFVKGFYAGLRAFCTQYGCRVAGGDTVSSPLTVVNVTATGILPKGHYAGLRANARPGDVVVTTGFHGLSALGLSALQQQAPGFEVARQKHLRPQPRVGEGQLLAQNFSRYALMDSSDGLADALLRMATASNVSIEIDTAAIPVHPEFGKQDNSLETILYGGEDFELVAAVPELAPELAGHFTVIGRVVSATADYWVALNGSDGKRMETLTFERTYQHFAGEPR